MEIATPLAAYSVRDRLGRDLFLFVQHGSYQWVPVEEQPLLDSGDVILYRGVHESDVFRFLQVDCHNLDQEKRDVWQKYIKTQEQMLSDSILSFNTIHDRTKRCETSHILDGTWMGDEIAKANDLNIEGDGFAAELWQAAHQSFTLVSWMAKNKFGPHFVKCRTSIGNLRLTTFFANEHEVRIIDPDLVEILDAHGCRVEHLPGCIERHGRR